MPRSAKVDIFYREIGGDQEFEAGLRAQERAVVADAAEHGAIAARLGEAADGGDQGVLGSQWRPPTVLRGHRNCSRRVGFEAYNQVRGLKPRLMTLLRQR
jgi:hypothetical protein